MTITCPACGATFRDIDDALSGKKARCKKCGHLFTIPPSSDSDKTLILSTNTDQKAMAEASAKTLANAGIPPSPMETVREEQTPPPPQETIRDDNLSAPLATVREEESGKPAETIREAPHATVTEEPGVTVMAGAPGEPVGDPASVPDEWSVGDLILGLYEVTALLGEGGMGKVFKVRHRGWNIDLAVKCPKPEELLRAGGAETFEREAETWVNLGLHPNSVSCYYVRRLGSAPRLFAEYVDGGSLSDWIREGRLTSIAPILDIAIQFAWGLDYAHQRGLVHQDVKPANVMLTHKGVAKVTDFGLAVARSEGDGADVAFGGMTPAYCSPEQANRKRLTLHTDIWSFALSLLEIFQGEVTWMNGVAAQEALRAYRQTGAPNKAIAPMPEGVAALLANCFAADPADRPPSMAAVANRLIALYHDETGVHYPRPEPRAGRETADSLNNRAISLLDLGRVEEALALWREAEKNEPHHAQTTYNSGLLRWRRGESTDLELVNALEEVIKSQQEGMEGGFFLGLVHLERDDCAAAEETITHIGKESGLEKDVEALRKTLAEKKGTARRRLKSIALAQSAITSLLINPEASLLLVGDDTGSLSLLSLPAGDKQQSWPTGEESITAIALSRDGATVATGHRGRVEISDTAGNRRATFCDCYGWIDSLHFSPDGSALWVIDGERTLHIIDPDSGEGRDTKKTGALLLSLDDAGERLLTYSDTDGMTLLDRVNNVELNRWEGVATAIGLSRSGRYALMADLDNNVHLYDTTTGELTRRFSGATTQITSLALSPDDSVLLTCGYDGALLLYHTATGRLIRSFSGDGSVIGALALTQDGALAVTGSWSGGVDIWDLAPTSVTHPAPLMVSRVQASEIVLSAGVAYEKELQKMREALEKGDAITAARAIRAARTQQGFARGEEAITAWGDLYTRLQRTRLRGGWEARSYSGHTGAINALALSPDNTKLLTGSTDQTARLWNLSGGQNIATFTGHQESITAVAFDGSGERLITASGDGSLRFWAATGREALSVMAGHRGGAAAVTLSWDGRIAVSGGADAMVKLWGTKEGRPLRSLRGHGGAVLCVALSADGRYALSGSEDRSVRWWDMATGDTLGVLAGHRAKVNTLALSLEGTRAISGSEDGVLIVWDMTTGEEVSRIVIGDTPILSVALSFDARTMLCVDAERNMRVYNVESGELLRLFTGHTQKINGATFSADGRSFVSCSDDKTARRFILDWELADEPSAEFDDGFIPLIELFLTLRTPVEGSLPCGREIFDTEVNLALTRNGAPQNIEGEMATLITWAQQAGYGWIEHDRLATEVIKMVESWPGPRTPTPVVRQEENAEEEESPDINRRLVEPEIPIEERKTIGLTSWIRSFGTQRKKEG